METGLRVRNLTSFVFLLAAASTGVQAQGTPAQWFEEFEKRFPPTKKNAAAEDVEHYAIALGIEVNAEDPEGEHPAKEDADAYNQASFGSWLDAQVKTSDDFIAPPPAKLRDFLEKRQSVLWRLVGRLEGEAPEWGYDFRDNSRKAFQLLPAFRINRVLLSAALLEEREGRHVEAERLLEASWSLSHSFVELPTLIAQLIAIGMAKHQVGVLRKLSDPSGEWLERLSSDRPWQKLIDSYEYDHFTARSEGNTPNDEPFFEQWVRGWRALADNLREHSPCVVSKLSADEVWEPMDNELKGLPSTDGSDSEQVAKVFKDISSPNVVNALRRGARLVIDRELTAKILEIRQEKAALRPPRWPEKFADTESRMCPGESYEYQVKGAAFAIRFKGSIGDPGEPALVLPLSFETKPPKPTPTPTRTPQPNRTRSPHP